MTDLKTSFNLHGAMILGLFILFSSGNALAARWANVVVNKAVVYSDLEMSSEIGFIRKGKKVRVGEVAKNKGRLLPIIVNKRVAYIKIVDLNISKDIKTLQTVTERVTKKMDKVTEKRSIGVYGGLFLSNFQTTDDDASSSNTDTDNLMYGGGLSGYYTNLEEDWTLKVSFEIMKYSKDESNITYYSLNVGKLIKSLSKRRDSQMDIYAGVVINPFIEFKISDDFILNGQGLGGFVGGEYVYQIGKASKLHLEGQLEVVKQFNFGSGTNNTVAKEVGKYLNGYFYGPKVFLKYSFDY